MFFYFCFLVSRRLSCKCLSLGHSVGYESAVPHGHKVHNEHFAQDVHRIAITLEELLDAGVFVAVGFDNLPNLVYVAVGIIA